MAHSIITYPGAGTTGPFVVNFTLGYISTDHVRAWVVGEVDGEGNQLYRTLAWVTPGTVTVSGAAIAVGQSLVISRDTPVNALIHDYQDGGVLNEANLDESNLQNIMLAQEALDGKRVFELYEDMNAAGFTINNLGSLEVPTPLTDNSAVPRIYVDSGLPAYLAGVQADVDAEVIAVAASASAASASADAASNSAIAADASADAAAVSAAAAAAYTDATTLQGNAPAAFAVAAKGVTNGDTHDHIGGDGNAIVEAALTLADNTTNNVSVTKHGFVPKAPNDAEKFLRGDATWGVPPAPAMLLVGSAVLSPADNLTYYIGCQPGMPPQQVSASVLIQANTAAVVNRVSITMFISGTVGTGEAISVYFNIDGGASTLVATVSNTSSVKNFTNSALSIALAPGAQFNIKIVCPTAWVTNPTNCFFGGYIYLS